MELIPTYWFDICERNIYNWFVRHEAEIIDEAIHPRLSRATKPTVDQ